MNSIDLAQKIRICDVIALTLWCHQDPFGANLVCLLFCKCPTFIYQLWSQPDQHPTKETLKRGNIQSKWPAGNPTFTSFKSIERGWNIFFPSKNHLGFFFALLLITILSSHFFVATSADYSPTRLSYLLNYFATRGEGIIGWFVLSLNTCQSPLRGLEQRISSVRRDACHIVGNLVLEELYLISLLVT